MTNRIINKKNTEKFINYYFKNIFLNQFKADKEFLTFVHSGYLGVLGIKQ